MHAALWPATIGYFLEQMLDGAAVSAAVIDRVRELFVTRVRGAGPLPTLRIGRTPYGLLPIAVLASWTPDPGRTADVGITSLLREVRASWDAAAGGAPRLVEGASDQDVARVLAMAPVSTSYVGRSVIGAAYATYLYDFLRAPLPAAWWTAHDLRARSAWMAARLAHPENRLARATYADSHFTVTGPVVQATLDEQPLAPNYIATLAAGTLEQIRDAAELPPSTPLLYRLLRHAAMSAYLGAARRTRNPTPIEPELIGLGAIPAPWSWLDAPTRTALDAARSSGRGDPAFVAVWPALAALATAPSRRLDALVRDALDACSHRLDAWLTALASERLEALRAAQPSGIHVGGYAFVAGVTRAPRAPVTTLPADEPGELFAAAAPGGFIHASSLDHATTAAILRSGYLAHRADSTTSFAVDLRSHRMRAATAILDDLRAGDALADVLRRRLERAVMDATTPPLWSFLPALRELGITGAASVPWNQHGMPAQDSPAGLALAAILAANDDAVDAIGDLLVAESAHQIGRGNLERGAAALDTIALGATPPRELEVLEIPSRGIGLSHTLVALVPANTVATGWASTPRAGAEPALEAWCASVLGPATAYRVNVARGATVQMIGFDTLGLGALDIVRLCAADELAAWIADRTGGSVDPTPPANARSLDDAMLLAGSLAQVLASVRGATPTDFDDPGAVDVADLEARGSDSALGDALGLLATDVAAGLRAAAMLGVAGAIPAADPAKWPGQAVAATAALTARRTALVALPSATTPDDRLTRAVSRLRLIYGDDLVVAPRFRLLNPAIAASFDDRPTLADASEPAAWLAQIAAVRARVAALDRALFVATTLADDRKQLLRVAQLPHVAGSKWIGSAVFGGDEAPAARRGFAIHAPLGLDLTAPVAGLFIDRWSETVPAARQTTAVAFQVDQPHAAAPQAILLAVPSDPAAPTWTDDAIAATVREALALAKLRLVDGDAIGSTGQFLPPLYFAINLANDTASTDFTGGG